jgi:hypothetical protein
MTSDSVPYGAASSAQCCATTVRQPGTPWMTPLKSSAATGRRFPASRPESAASVHVSYASFSRSMAETTKNSRPSSRSPAGSARAGGTSIATSCRRPPGPGHNGAARRRSPHLRASDGAGPAANQRLRPGHRRNEPHTCLQRATRTGRAGSQRPSDRAPREAAAQAHDRHR